MKIKQLIFAFMILGTILYVSCRKTDFKIENTASEPNNKSKFFDEYAPTNPSIKSVAGFVKRENEKYGFEKQLIKRIGFPRWDKALVFKTKPVSSEGIGTETVAEEIVYIPFVRDSQNFVNTSLIVKITNTDTAFRFLQDWQYKDYGFDSATSTEQWRAKDVFNVFATMDHTVFGHEKWEIKDSRIFGINTLSNDSTVVVTRSPIATESLVLICQSYNVCVIAGPSSQNRTQYSTEDDDSHAPGSCSSVTYCTFYSLGGGSSGGSSTGGSGSGGTGGSGSGGGTGTGGGSGSGDGGTGWSSSGDGGTGWELPPNPCPELPRTAIVTDIFNPCDNGWIPIPDPNPNPNPNPVNEDSLIAENLKRLYNKGLAMSNSLFASAQLDKDERTFTYVINGANDTVPMFPLVGSQYTSSPQLAYNYIGVWHSHQDEGVANRDQSFDGADINKSFYHYIINKGFANSIITTQDYIYAAVVTDPTKFKAHIKNITGATRLDEIEEKLNNLHISEMNACQNCTWQKKSEMGALALTANNNSVISGIKIFKSPRQVINFTLLTP